MTQQTRTIAESNNFIVLDKYVTEWEAVTATRVNRS
jgi:type I restriction enzyme R subunit